MASASPSPDSTTVSDNHRKLVASNEPPPSPDIGERPTHARFLVSDEEAGLLIGKAGSTVRAVEARSGARIMFSAQGHHLPGTQCRVLLLSGLFRTVMDAAELILEKLICQQGDNVADGSAQASVVLVVPDACCGALIGKGGHVIKSLAQVSNAGINISPRNICYGQHDRLVTITGQLDNQLQAIFLILSELLDVVHYSCSDAAGRTINIKQTKADVIAGTHHVRLPSEAEYEKFGPYFSHLVDKFIGAIAKDVKEKSNDDIAYKRGYQQKTIEYANSALKQYNCANNKTADYELVEAISSCGIVDTKGLYAHANFTARNKSNSKLDFFFAELFWDSEKDNLVTTCVVSLEEEDRVGGFRGMEGVNYRDGMNIRVDPQHCYACRADLKHPVDGGLYGIGHKAMSECYGYDS